MFVTSELTLVFFFFLLIKISRSSIAYMQENNLNSCFNKLHNGNTEALPLIRKEKTVLVF